MNGKINLYTKRFTINCNMESCVLTCFIYWYTRLRLRHSTTVTVMEVEPLASFKSS